MVGVTALCFFQCFDAVGSVTRRTWPIGSDVVSVGDSLDLRNHVLDGSRYHRGRGNFLGVVHSAD